MQTDERAQLQLELAEWQNRAEIRELEIVEYKATIRKLNEELQATKQTAIGLGGEVVALQRKTKRLQRILSDKSLSAEEASSI
jgi:hypothetical protein